MTDTPNHKYNQPAEGTTDWHKPLNENFEKLDSDVEIRDSEANKGDYEPKQDAKYEATDSGAIYYGNGTSWVLANRRVEKFQAKDVNGVLTPQKNTIQAIQDLVSEYRNPHIKLKPGVMYEGDTQLVLDSYPSGEYERQIYINAYGAGVNYTGKKESAVRIFQRDVYQTNKGDASAFGGKTKIEFGTWLGPGKEVSNSAVIREDDTFGTVILPTKVSNAEHGILAVNNGAWSEGLKLGVKNTGEYEGSVTTHGKDYLVRLAGGASDFPDAGSNSGGPSFRDTDVIIPWGSADNIIFWQDHASTHGGHHVVRGFLPSGGTGYKLDSAAAVNRYCQVEFESEGGNANSIAIDVSNANGVPMFIAPRIQTEGKNVKGSLTRLSEVGWKGSPLKVTPPHGGFDTNWLSANYPGTDDTKYTITNRKNSFALKHNNDSFVSSWDSNNNYAPFRGSEFQAQSPQGTGNRSFMGGFDSHPDGSAGDVWYITGNGSPSEGYYGQTSDGVVQIG